MNNMAKPKTATTGLLFPEEFQSQSVIALAPALKWAGGKR